MMLHPELLYSLARDRQRELIAEADQARLLRSARRARKARKGDAVRGQPTGSLTSCEASAAVPVR